MDVSRFFLNDQVELNQCGNCKLLYYGSASLGDGRFYDELQNYKGYYLDDKPEFAIASKFISGEDAVLEVGCGKGAFTKYISPKSYQGLEFSEKAIEQARESGIGVINQSIEEHASGNADRYDVVCFFQVLEHIEKPLEFIEASVKVLKKGGKLILAVPSEDSFIAKASNFYLNMPPHHATRWPDETLRKIPEVVNLKLVNIIHEHLHDIHKTFYIKTVMTNRIRSFVGLPYQPIDNKFANLIIESVSAVIARIGSPFLNGKKRTGQSVLAVYEKI